MPHDPAFCADDHAAKLLDEAALAGLRITDLDGWSQTRLAGSLHLRREVVNAIINRGPSAEPSAARPKMVEACRKIIAFAAVISRKDDAVVPREVDLVSRLDDDAQAYEAHKVRLRRVVEDAAAGGAFIESMYRVGELTSHAVHAPPRFRIKMVGNLVTAIQRLLDKPQSRSIPLDVLCHNLRRLTTAEWAARRAARELAGDAVARAKAADDLRYIRGQVGYAMIFNGLLAQADRAVRRGYRRLSRAARLQPSGDCGHWSNLLRAINDLMASGHTPARDWAAATLRLAEGQDHPGFAAAFTRLRDNGELTTLASCWDAGNTARRLRAVLARPAAADSVAHNATPKARRGKRTNTAAAILLLFGLATLSPSARAAGDGKELSRRSDPGQRVAAAGPSAVPLAVPPRNSIAAPVGGGGVSGSAGVADAGAIGRVGRADATAVRGVPVYPTRAQRTPPARMGSVTGLAVPAIADDASADEAPDVTGRLAVPPRGSRAAALLMTVLRDELASAERARGRSPETESESDPAMTAKKPADKRRRANEDPALPLPVLIEAETPTVHVAPVRAH